MEDAQPKEKARYEGADDFMNRHARSLQAEVRASIAEEIRRVEAVIARIRELGLRSEDELPENRPHLYSPE